MTGVSVVTLDREAEGQRLDRWFKRHYPGLPYGQLQKLLRGGQIRLDGKRAKASSRLAAGQRLRLPPLDKPAATGRATRKRPNGEEARLVGPRDRQLLERVLYKDAWVIAIDKPSGLAVQGGTGQDRHLDAMLETLRFEAPERPRLVHRLDKDTSGVLLLARHALSARLLGKAFREKTARKIYSALVAGRPPNERGVIAVALAKQGRRGAEKVAGGGPDAKKALTLYRQVQSLGRRLSWLLLMPMTGRTHQLRAHMALLGTPVLGDGKYGGRAAFPKGYDLPRRLMLHAREIAVPHPESGLTLRVTAPLPPEMRAAWDCLRFDVEEEEIAARDLLDYAGNF